MLASLCASSTSARGSCDIPLAASRWARSRGIPLHFTCLEVADHAVDIARRQLARAGDPAVQLLQEDIFTHQPTEPYDLAVASMCFHHFSNAQILTLLQRLRGFVLNSVLINDLRRSRLAARVSGGKTASGRYRYVSRSPT